MEQQYLLSTPLKLALLPGMADLYNRLWPDELIEQVAELTQNVAARFQKEGYEVEVCDVVCTAADAITICERLKNTNIDLLIVAVAPYCPSGILAPALKELDIPFLLWPMGTLAALDPNTYDLEAIKLNHGVHAVQDCANVLNRYGVHFGVMHGYWEEPQFLAELQQWACAGRALKSLCSAHPVQIGGHFEDMLDLQVHSTSFMSELGITPYIESLDSFSKRIEDVEEADVIIKRYREVFELADNVTNEMLVTTARREAALRTLLDEHDSHAVGLNFLGLCNDERVKDALHVPASMLMLDGYGYAAEGDWVTAAFFYAMQQACGVASFTEMFSVGYANNRIVLRHWGEGNPSLSRSTPMILKSEFKDQTPAEFLITNFEFEPGEVTLVNLSAAKEGQGQLISIVGSITNDSLPKTDGPRAVFEPASSNVIDLLNNYAYQGGSHHLVLVPGNVTAVIHKLSILTGWDYIAF